MDSNTDRARSLMSTPMLRYTADAYDDQSQETPETVATDMIANLLLFFGDDETAASVLSTALDHYRTERHQDTAVFPLLGSDVVTPDGHRVTMAVQYRPDNDSGEADYVVFLDTDADRLDGIAPGEYVPHND
jgi:hypothetical protein